MKEYTGKYTESGKVGAFLINNYFKNVYDLVSLTNISSKNYPKVLEVGCGPGYSTKRIMEVLPKDTNILASDIEVENLQDAKKLIGDKVSLSKESIYNLQIEDNSIDLLFALEVLEHLEDPEKALEEIKRVIKEYAILGVPREPMWRVLNMARCKYLKNLGNTPGHIQHWSTFSFKKFLKSNGFKIVEVKKPLPWSIILIKKFN